MRLEHQAGACRRQEQQKHERTKCQTFESNVAILERYDIAKESQVCYAELAAASEVGRWGGENRESASAASSKARRSIRACRGRWIGCLEAEQRGEAGQEQAKNERAPSSRAHGAEIPTKRDER